MVCSVPAVEFGLVLGPFFPPREEMSSQDAVALQLRFADRAAESGFEYVSMGHHYLSGPLAQFFQPIPLAASILTRHPSLSVATTIFLLPYHNPVEMAEHVATLDALAPGRFILGVGAGYRRAEAEAAGIANASRKERLAESIEAMRLLWRGGPCSFEGRHYRFHDADIGISTADPNGPPILIGADTVETVAKIPSLGGDHWIANPRNSVTFIREALPVYREALSAEGRDFRGLPLLRNVYLTDDEQSGLRALGQSLQKMAAIQANWGQPGERARPSIDEVRREKQIILGNAEQVAESLVELNRDVAAECVFLTLLPPRMDPGASLEMVAALGEQVLPPSARGRHRVAVLGLVAGDVDVAGAERARLSRVGVVGMPPDAPGVVREQVNRDGRLGRGRSDSVDVVPRRDQGVEVALAGAHAARPARGRSRSGRRSPRPACRGRGRRDPRRDGRGSASPTPAARPGRRATAIRRRLRYSSHWPIPPPIPLSGAGSRYSAGSQSESASRSAKPGLIASHASSGDEAPSIASRTLATNNLTTGVSRTNAASGMEPVTQLAERVRERAALDREAAEDAHQPLLALGSEPEHVDAPVFRRALAPDQAGLLRPLDQLGHRRLAEVEVAAEPAHGRRLRPVLGRLDHQQQVVALGRQPGLVRRALGAMDETPQLCPERRGPFELVPKPALGSVLFLDCHRLASPVDQFRSVTTGPGLVQ